MAEHSSTVMGQREGREALTHTYAGQFLRADFGVYPLISTFVAWSL
jgi:hypothetical protein